MKINFMNGNIADMCVDAIVLPANSRLKEGSGSSRALFERAGRKKLQHFCEVCIDKYGILNIGDVVATPAFKLQAECILHAVVPHWVDGNSEEYVNLMMTYINALRQADTMGCRSIAFPLLASGNNGFSLELAFQIAQEAIEGFEAENTLKSIYLVLFGDRVVRMAIDREFKVHMIKKNYRVRYGNGSVGLSAESENNFMEKAFELWEKAKEFDEAHPEVRQWATKAIKELVNRAINKGGKE